MPQLPQHVTPVELMAQRGSIRARVWLNTSGLPQITPTHSMQVRCASASIPLTARHASVELWIPTGGRVYCGALGASIEPSQGAQAECHILWGSEAHGTFAPTWARPPAETMRAGLDEEYVQSIVEGVKDLEQRHELPSGVMTFDSAMYGEVGSSPMLFRALTRMVLRLLCIPEAAYVAASLDDAVGSVLESKWRR